jgi:hypothetical protein
MAACRRYELFEARREKKESSGAGGLRCIVEWRKTVYLNTLNCVKGYNIKVMGGLLVSETVTD